jgi:hypothetical protein
MNARIMSRTTIMACFLLMPLFTPCRFTSYGQEKIDLENYRLDVPNAPIEKKRQAKVTLINGQKLKGTITAIGEKSIELENVVYKNSKGGRPGPKEAISFNEINYKDIQYIATRASVGKTIKGFFVGTGAGVVGGGVAGLGLAVKCEDCNLEESVGLIVVFAGIGSVLGGPVGAVEASHAHFKIEGQRNNFVKFKNKMDKKKVKRKRRE